MNPYPTTLVTPDLIRGPERQTVTLARDTRRQPLWMPRRARHDEVGRNTAQQGSRKSLSLQGRGRETWAVALVAAGEGLCGIK